MVFFFFFLFLLFTVLVGLNIAPTVLNIQDEHKAHNLIPDTSAITLSFYPH